MSATDELRRLLDERGVEYDGSFGVTEFYGVDGSAVVACNSKSKDKDGVLYVHAYLTPEQAVEATLGRGTCKQVETEEGFIVCSECGAPQPEDYTVYYCWCCGRKVVA